MTKVVGTLAVLTVLLTGCGDPDPDDMSPAELVSALLADGWRVPSVHDLPGPERMRELYGEERASQLAWPDPLTESPYGQELLERGDGAVPFLAEQLATGSDQAVAAHLLGRIGTRKSAEVLLDAWRAHQDEWKRRRLLIYDADGTVVHRPHGSVLLGASDSVADALHHALCLTARHVSAQVATDTRAAMARLADLRAAEAPLLESRELPPERRFPHGGRLEWEVAPLRRTKEGLRMLAAAGAAHAVPVAGEALGYDDAELLHEVASNALFMGAEVAPLLPRLLARLDELGSWHRERLLHTLGNTAAWVMKRKGLSIEGEPDAEKLDLAGVRARLERAGLLP